jgi:hypothetical protein
MSEGHEVKSRTEVRDGMRITWHQPIEIEDGLVLRADVYRPVEDGQYPVILDYEYEGELSEFGEKFHYGTRGTGGMTHNDRDSRPPDVFGGRVTLHAGGTRESYLLLPIIPSRSA